jgi:hypothetical protein
MRSSAWPRPRGCGCRRWRTRRRGRWRPQSACASPTSHPTLATTRSRTSWAPCLACTTARRRGPAAPHPPTVWPLVVQLLAHLVAHCSTSPAANRVLRKCEKRTACALRARTRQRMRTAAASRSRAQGARRRAGGGVLLCGEPERRQRVAAAHRGRGGALSGRERVAGGRRGGPHQRRPHPCGHQPQRLHQGARRRRRRHRRSRLARGGLWAARPA